MNNDHFSERWGIWQVLLFIILPLAIGTGLSFLIPQPIIGVINIRDTISGYTSPSILQQIDYAREQANIKAVVIALDTPGGTVVDTESIYREIIKLRKVKPVIGVVEGMAASGGFYIACGTDFILAKASSEVGNVGVIGTMPSKPVVFEDEYSTGPYKMWGMPQDIFLREVEMLKNGFLQVVKTGRGERLKTTDDTILRGQLYTGSEALSLGLIDEFGSLSDGYEKAAALAQVKHYAVSDLMALSGATPPPSLYPLFGSADASKSKAIDTSKQGFYLVYPPALEE